MGKTLDGIMAAGCAMVLAGAIGFAVCKGQADDSYSKNVARAIALENVLDGRSSRQVLAEWRRRRHEALEGELNGLKANAYLMQDKEQYESARGKEGAFVTLMFAGYTLCIAGRLKEKSQAE